MSNPGTSEQLDQQVVAFLEATLSPDYATRTSAEQQISELYNHPGKSSSLSSSNQQMLASV